MKGVSAHFLDSSRGLGVVEGVVGLGCIFTLRQMRTFSTAHLRPRGASE